MRIAIDGRALTGRFTGDRTYWRSLLSALLRLDASNEYTIFTRTPIPEGELPSAANLRGEVLPARNDRIWTLAALPRALRQARPDLVHCQYTLPPQALCPCPAVTTVHDISFRLYPEWFPLKHRILLNLTVPRSMRQAVRVITDSESSRRDMRNTYQLAEDKIVAIPLGLPEGFGTANGTALEKEIADDMVKERYGITAPFVLAVGVLQPRKNLHLLAEAFGIAKKRYDLPHQLVFVGKAGWGAEHTSLREACARGGGAEAVRSIVFTGYVPDADLPALYRACEVFTHPALYEGFGIPPLEAMACGAPTLVSDAPAMPEVVGDAALVLPARDANAWADAFGSVLRDAALRSDLAGRGPVRASLFTWEKTAERTLDVYRSAAI